MYANVNKFAEEETLTKLVHVFDRFGPKLVQDMSVN
jgi:hypothetical protein